MVLHKPARILLVPVTAPAPVTNSNSGIFPGFSSISSRVTSPFATTILNKELPLPAVYTLCNPTAAPVKPFAELNTCSSVAALGFTKSLIHPTVPTIAVAIKAMAIYFDLIIFIFVIIICIRI